MIEGIKIVLSVFVLTLVISIPLGIIISFLRNSNNKLISAISKGYILIVRGTPLLLQLIFIFFGLPIVGIVFDRFAVAVIAFSLNYAVYFAEIFRGGIQSIDKGQYEASLVLGFDKFNMYKRIIFPQAIKRILPAMTNEVTTLVKDTSLVYILGLNDILRVAQIASNRDVSLVPLMHAALIYLLFIGIITQVFKVIEKKYSYYRG
ncbi:amino acid ABC transporter permease [Romboutsia sedimentorum]|uniref:Amino acid ABC transporter permease n=1 Tax=Romboutsia sedimentorum TaxID=1368474 RepID=A0ABT7EBN3_9FIRM|nr:amino acid ABC transporter permease [Romboutsia sedimentorum]MDK2564112.1 amino acid ABC transporter permease [Romboutsia sedimentorum]MDK2587418.1 amino acid ABC transporter permease [Romboutsia sedimentorum]